MKFVFKDLFANEIVVTYSENDNLSDTINAFADQYIRANLDSLSVVFASLIKSQTVCDDFSFFLKNIRRCAADAMYNALAETEEYCDPISIFLQRGSQCASLYSQKLTTKECFK